MNEGMGIIERIVKWVEEKKIFVRERKSNVESDSSICFIW